MSIKPTMCALAVILVLAVIAGCGDGESKNKDDASNDQHEKSDAPAKRETTYKQLDAKIDMTTLQIDKVARKLDHFNLDIGRYPTDDEGLDALLHAPDGEIERERWAGPYAKAGELKDAWGNEFHYAVLEPGASLSDGSKFKLWSNGPDGATPTEDDILSWRK